MENLNIKLESNHQVMEFLEDIIYCPSQIEFYFHDDKHVWCLYIRQRHGDTCAYLVPCELDGEFIYKQKWEKIELSRDYDIEGCSYKSEKYEEHEIIAIEKECLSRLKTRFPNVHFPEHPNRRRHRYNKLLQDVVL